MLHTKLKLTLLGLACGVIAGCNSAGDSIADCVEYLPVQLREGKSWSFIDQKGNIVAEDEFKNAPSAVINGLFSVEEGSTYSLYNIKDLKKEVLSDLVSVGALNEGVIPVTQKNERITLVDKNGKVKATLEPVDGKEITNCAAYVQEGMLTIKTQDDKWGYADASGKVIIKPQYDWVGDFSDGVAVVRKSSDDDETIFSVIDKSGKELFKLKEGVSFHGSFHDGLMAVYDNEKEVWGFINKKGEIKKLPNKVKGISDFNADYFTYLNEDYEWGVMNMAGETVIKAKYNRIAILKDGNFFAATYNEDKERYSSCILDKKGEKTLEFDGYKEVYVPGLRNFEFVGKNKKYALLNNKGEQIGDNDFANVGDMIHSAYVTSDYFDAESVAEALTSELKDGGLGKYTAGMPATSLGIKDYDGYVWETRYFDEEMNKQGWLYNISFTVITDESIARREGEYDAFYNWVSRVVPNTTAMVETIIIEADCQKACWKNIKESLISKIKEKGYTLKEDGGDSVVFTGKNSNLTLSSSNDGKDITIAIGAAVTPAETAYFNSTDSIADWGEEVVEEVAW